MADQLSVPQHITLLQLYRGPLIIIRTIGNVGWAIQGERKRFCSTQTIRALEGHGFVTINGGKASITARGKRFLQDRAAVRANLRSAAQEIAAAAAILIGDWPTPDDYEKQS